MRSHEFRTDMIYQEIVKIAESNNGVIDEEMAIKMIEERGIHVTAGVVRSRINYYLEHAPKTDINSKKD